MSEFNDPFSTGPSADEAAVVAEAEAIVDEASAIDEAAEAVAVIEAEGDIVDGKDQGGNPFAGGSSIHSDDLADAFYAAIKAKDVKAIVFRLNSPGGSDTASEQILAAIRAAKAAGKPVVVSMGTYGASGGYWVSSQASAIVAEPRPHSNSAGRRRRNPRGRSAGRGAFLIGPLEGGSSREDYGRRCKRRKFVSQVSRVLRRGDPESGGVPSGGIAGGRTFLSGT